MKDTLSATGSGRAETRSDAQNKAREVVNGVGVPVRDRSRYVVLGEHGRGGLGRVLRAHDRELGRDVAIKELISRGAMGEVRFLREAFITARLEHPGIVPVHDAGRWEDGTPFYAMKLVAGRPLRALLAERRTRPERLALLPHVIAVAEAIAYAHGRRIIHRDLKPANVIVGDFGETVVIDWGLAKELSAQGDDTVSGHDGLTATGAVMGTPAYMAPEQASGAAADQRADVYALGAMLWELCSEGRATVVEPAVRRRRMWRSGVDRDLVAIIDKAMASDPDDRYDDAGGLVADLKAFAIGCRVSARRYSAWTRVARWVRRKRALAAPVLVVFGLMAAEGALVARHTHAARPSVCRPMSMTCEVMDDHRDCRAARSAPR